MIFDYPYTDMHELNLDWFLAKFKELVEEWNQVQGEWTSLHDYVQNYFDNLNVQTEIDNKINAMILDGTFADIVSPFVTAALPALVAGQLPDVVAAQISAVVAAQISAVVADQLPAVAASAAAAEVGVWLAAHIDPDTGYVIDKSLTVSDAAADAKTVGDILNDVNNTLNDLGSFTEKVFKRNQRGSLNTTAGVALSANTSIIPCKVEANTDFNIILTFNNNVFSNNKITAMYAVKNDDSVTLIKSNVESDVVNNFNLAYDIKGISFYVVAADVLASDVITSNIECLYTQIDNMETRVDNKISKNNIFALDLIDGTDVHYRSDYYEINASHNNDGNATYIYKKVIDKHSINNILVMRCKNIINASNTRPIYIYFYDALDSQISNVQPTLDQVKNGIIIYPPDNTVTYSVILYPSVSGGLTDSYAKYYDLTIIESDKYINYFNSLGNMINAVPYYYFENDYLDNKIDTIASLIADSDTNYDVFIFCTDQHWSLNAKRSPALMKYICDTLNIPRMFMGGDQSDGIDINGLKAYRDGFNNKIYWLTGNHEYMNYLTPLGKSMISETMDDSTIWMYLNMNIPDVTDVVPSRNYYYIDNKIQKMRYIILNVFADNGASAIPQFELSQQEWFENKALDIPDGYTAIVMAHYLYKVTKTDPIELPNYLEPVIDAVDNYNGNGKIACLISGHTHVDGMTTTPGGIPVFVTTCDKYKPWIDGGVDKEPWLTAERHYGTITEQAFDVVVIDKTNQLVSCVRIGAPADNGDLTPLEVRQQYYS